MKSPGALSAAVWARSSGTSSYRSNRNGELDVREEKAVEA